jgi:hypothetical protein
MFLHSCLSFRQDVLAQNKRMRVGIITYDTCIQFYSLKPSSDPDKSAQPQMFVVSDVDDVFVPCPTNEILVHVSKKEVCTRPCFSFLFFIFMTLVLSLFVESCSFGQPAGYAGVCLRCQKR